MDENQAVLVTHEDHLPNDVKRIEKWIQGIEIDRLQKLNFSTRVSNSMPFKTLRETTMSWCKQNNCFFSLITLFRPRYSFQVGLKVPIQTTLIRIY